eukprot:Nk52_evm10s163 gene=Nk52_evmTU10s163
MPILERGVSVGISVRGEKKKGNRKSGKNTNSGTAGASLTKGHGQGVLIRGRLKRQRNRNTGVAGMAGNPLCTGAVIMEERHENRQLLSRSPSQCVDSSPCGVLEGPEEGEKEEDGDGEEWRCNADHALLQGNDSSGGRKRKKSWFESLSNHISSVLPVFGSDADIASSVKKAEAGMADEENQDGEAENDWRLGGLENKEQKVEAETSKRPVAVQETKALRAQCDLYEKKISIQEEALKLMVCQYCIKMARLGADIGNVSSDEVKPRIMDRLVKNCKQSVLDVLGMEIGQREEGGFVQMCQNLAKKVYFDSNTMDSNGVFPSVFTAGSAGLFNEEIGAKEDPFDERNTLVVSDMPPIHPVHPSQRGFRSTVIPVDDKKGKYCSIGIVHDGYQLYTSRPYDIFTAGVGDAGVKNMNGVVESDRSSMKKVDLKTPQCKEIADLDAYLGGEEFALESTLAVGGGIPAAIKSPRYGFPSDAAAREEGFRLELSQMDDMYFEKRHSRDELSEKRKKQKDLQLQLMEWRREKQLEKRFKKASGGSFSEEHNDRESEDSVPLTKIALRKQKHCWCKECRVITFNDDKEAIKLNASHCEELLGPNGNIISGALKSFHRCIQDDTLNSHIKAIEIGELLPVTAFGQPLPVSFFRKKGSKKKRHVNEVSNDINTRAYCPFICLTIEDEGTEFVLPRSLHPEPDILASNEYVSEEENSFSSENQRGVKITPEMLGERPKVIKKRGRKPKNSKNANANGSMIFLSSCTPSSSSILVPSSLNASCSSMNTSMATPTGIEGAGVKKVGRGRGRPRKVITSNDTVSGGTIGKITPSASNTITGRGRGKRKPNKDVTYDNGQNVKTIERPTRRSGRHRTHDDENEATKAPVVDPPFKRIRLSQPKRHSSDASGNQDARKLMDSGEDSQQLKETATHINVVDDVSVGQATCKSPAEEEGEGLVMTRSRSRSLSQINGVGLDKSAISRQIVSGSSESIFTNTPPVKNFNSRTSSSLISLDSVSAAATFSPLTTSQEQGDPFSKDG